VSQQPICVAIITDAGASDVYPATSPKWAQLWNQVLPAEEVLPTALALARRLAQENSVVR
jgi:hypothetical protein